MDDGMKKTILVSIGAFLITANAVGKENNTTHDRRIIRQTEDAFTHCTKDAGGVDNEMLECTFDAIRKLDIYIYQTMYKNQDDLVNEFNSKRETFCTQTTNYLDGNVKKINKSGCEYSISTKEILMRLYKEKEIVKIYKRLLTSSNRSSAEFNKKYVQIRNECEKDSQFMADLLNNNSIKSYEFTGCMQSTVVNNIKKLIK